jgi:hypothetical protein
VQARPVTHSIFVILIIALTSPLSTLNSFSAILLLALFWITPVFVVGVFLTMRYKEKIAEFTTIHLKPLNRNDWLCLLFSVALPLSTSILFRVESNAEQKSICDGRGAVDEACARTKCEPEIRQQWYQINKKPWSGRISELETVQLEREDKNKEKYWLVRGVMTSSIDNSSGSSVDVGHHLYVCYVNHRSNVWVKFSASETDRYPTEGSVLRQAFESNWRRQ